MIVIDSLKVGDHDEYNANEKSGAYRILLIGRGAHKVAVKRASSYGGFSNVQGCGGGFPGCYITNHGNQLHMSGFNNSTLVANDISGTNVGLNQDDYIIGELTWVNRASYFTDQNFNVKYTFTLTFSSPSNSSDFQTFDLNIQQPTNPTGDKILNLTQANFNVLGPFTLNGVTRSPTSNFKTWVMDFTMEPSGRIRREERPTFISPQILLPL